MPSPRASLPGLQTAVALAAATAFALAVAAADAQTDGAPIAACLAESDTRADDLACRDLVFELCLDTTGDDTTAGMVSCLNAEHQVWERELNRLWPRVRAMAAAADTGDAEGLEDANVAALLAAQRGWLAWRDAECAWQYQRYSGGTIRALMAGVCLLDITAERVADFREWLRDTEYEEDPQ